MGLSGVSSFVGTVGGGLLKATSSVVTGVAKLAEAHPLVTAAIIGYEVYEHYRGGPNASSSSGKVGGNVDTHA